MLKDMNLAQFNTEIAGIEPIPGGGSVAAYSGSMAASLVVMVAKLTHGKSGYEEVWDDMEEIRRQAEKLAGRLLELVDEDAAAYSGVIEAFRMPKEDEVDKVIRADAIQKAFRHAAEVPAATMRAASEVLRLAAMVAHKGNRNTITDTGVAGLMARSAIMGARFNVLVNLPSIKDEAFVAEMRDKVARICHEAEDIFNHIVVHIENSF